MDSLITEAMFILFFCVKHGTLGMFVHHNVSVSAVEGENVSLHCTVVEEDGIRVIQLEWTRQWSNKELKIVVFHNEQKAVYHQPGSVLETVVSPRTGKLTGSMLTLFNVTLNHSGKYICEIISFPYGSFKRVLQLQVAESSASVNMSNSSGFIKEGDEVKINCSASPPPLHYELTRSKDELFRMNSGNGKFILPPVTRNHTDLYICSPQWDSSGKNYSGLKATMEMNVNFLDPIECNVSTPLYIRAGEDTTISCNAKASQTLQYKWMRVEMVVSFSDTLSLTRITSNESGAYHLTAFFQNNHLFRNRVFYIHVLPNISRVEETSPSVRTTEHLKIFTSTGTNSWSSGATENSKASTDPLFRSSSKPKSTFTKLPSPSSRNQTALALTYSPPVPSAANASTLHIRSYHTLKDSSLTTQKNVLTEKASTKAAHVAVPIVFMLLVLLTVFLYRRYLNKKKMDMPPPFKPPPPPVKYTSVKNQDVPMTDILV
ncbi:hypothetical protein DNTS_020660 [Danionella cerebrum]|uniref:Ig-like domain-containing protein n=1 Tax=Danionella cerebrum TaxID=2873325 RepID=A0A553PZQ2_9TELE|nr:hypothetical protein DNTS_020660 [Danionella translucida]